MEHEISLGFLWKSLKKCWLLMIILAVVTALIVGIAVSIFIPKKYSSSVEFYVVNTNTSYDYTTSALLSASEFLINDYVKLIKSDAILDKVAEKVNADKPEGQQVSTEQLRGMISASSEESTSLFTIKVTHTDKALANEVANAIMEIAPSAVTDIAKPDRLTNEYFVNVAWKTMVALEKAYLAEAEPGKPLTDADAIAAIKDKYGDDVEAAVQSYLSESGLDGSLDCFTTVNMPVEDTAADSPNILKYAAVAAVAVAALIYVIFFIRGLFEMSVSSEGDVKKYVRRPLIGVVPHWDNSAKK